MGAAENAEVVRRAYEAFNTRDIETLTELFGEGACWHTPGRSSLAGDTENRDATFARFGRYAQETEGRNQAELRQVLADDQGHVVGVHHNSAERNGKRLDVGCCIAFEVEDGRITDGREPFTTSTPGTSSGRSGPPARPGTSSGHG